LNNNNDSKIYLSIAFPTLITNCFVIIHVDFVSNERNNYCGFENSELLPSFY
jgi:hypothetical protein